jgi:LppX_LprAFG lipoprotein
VNLKRFGVLAASAALALTAGCGGSGGAAADNGADLTKANFSSEVVKAQSAAKTAHVQATIEAQGQKMAMTGDMQMATKNVAFDLSMTGAALGGEARFILVDKVVYLKVPGLSQSDKFVKIDIGDKSNPIAKMFDQMLGQLDPSKTFRAFDAITKLQDRGTQEIDGVETTHYTVEVDTQKALQAQGLAGQVPTGQVPKTLTYDVWVDGDHLVRRLRMDIQGSAVDMSFSQWGEPVDIQAPPAGQIASMQELMKQLGGAPSGPAQG